VRPGAPPWPKEPGKQRSGSADRAISQTWPQPGTAPPEANPKDHEAKQWYILTLLLFTPPCAIGVIDVGRAQGGPAGFFRPAGARSTLQVFGELLIVSRLSGTRASAGGTPVAHDGGMLRVQ
jgi:hypothetical protein